MKRFAYPGLVPLAAEINDWATATNTTVFFFEAFNEPWEGNPDNPKGAEKHCGLFFVDRSPKLAMRR